MNMTEERQRLERELIELTAKCAQLADQMHVAASNHDARMVEELSIELYDIDKKTEETAFKLELIYEGSR